MIRPAPPIPLLFFAAAIAPLGLNVVVPALPAIGHAFAAPQSQVQLTVSVYLLLYALSQVVLGPLSDRIGRRPVLMVGTALFALASLWAAMAQNIETLIAARALQALGGCTALVVPRAVVRDTHTGPSALRAMARVTMALAVAPAVAPLFGGWLVALFDWRQVFVLCGLYGCAMLAWMWLRFGESLPVERRTRDTPESLARRYATLLRSPVFLGYATNMALLSLPFITFISLAPTLLIQRLGMSPAIYGLYHLLLGAAIVAGGFAAPRVALRVGLHRALVLSSVAGVVGMGLLLALASELSVTRLIGPMLLYAMASGACLPLALTGATNVDLQAAGASAALAGFGQMALGSLAVFGVNQFGAVVLPFAVVSFSCALLGLGFLALARIPGVRLAT